MLFTRLALISAVLLSQGSVPLLFEASSVKVNPAIKGITGNEYQSRSDSLYLGDTG